jgi:hypothetical protein
MLSRKFDFALAIKRGKLLNVGYLERIVAEELFDSRIFDAIRTIGSNLPTAQRFGVHV